MKGWVVLVKVRGHPAYPHAGRLLAWKDPHRVVVLNHGGREKKHDNGQYLQKSYNLSIMFGVGLKLNSGKENINFNAGNLWKKCRKGSDNCDSSEYAEFVLKPKTNIQK